MFENTAQKLDKAAILAMLGTVQKNLSFGLRRQGRSEKEADSLAERIMLESMRAANINIDDYYSVKSWAKAFRHESLPENGNWGFKGIEFVFGAMMLCLCGGLAAVCWHFSRNFFYAGLPLWGLGVIFGLLAIIKGVRKAIQGEQD